MKNFRDMHFFQALRSRNYSLYLAGKSISQFGTWMQRTAVVWVVYSITHSAFLLGATVFAETFPSFLFSIAGGVAADRYDRYKIIQITQVTSMIQAVTLAVLVLTGHPAIWLILALSVMLGIINAFDIPARQTLIHQVVADPADLPNAISLSTATASLAQLVGPALSGIVLNAFGAPVCFLINAATFGAVIISLLMMKLPKYVHKTSEKKVMTDFAEGFKYVVKAPNIGLIILMLALMSLLVFPYNTLLPVFAKVVFSGNAATFGYITSFVGIGAVVGTFFLASRRSGTNLKRILFVSSLVFGTGLICFAQIRNFPVAMFFVALTGFGAISQFSISNIIVQSGSAPEVRGRAISILLMAIFGMSPIGSLLAGAVSQHIGAPATVLAQGIIAIALALAFARFLTRSTDQPASDISVAVEETEELIEEQPA